MAEESALVGADLKQQGSVQEEILRRWRALSPGDLEALRVFFDMSDEADEPTDTTSAAYRSLNDGFEQELVGENGERRQGRGGGKRRKGDDGAPSSKLPLKLTKLSEIGSNRICHGR